MLAAVANLVVLPTAVLGGFALVLTAVATRVLRWDDV
jgi:hypothetical protein